MKSKGGFFLLFVVLIGLAGTVQPQQSGIGRFERMQNLASNLQDATRSMYLRAERQFPQFRSDLYVLNRLYNLRQRAADFRHQLERNGDNYDALRRSYQRLYSAWYDADYVIRGRSQFGLGNLNDEFYEVSVIVRDLGHSLGIQNRGFYDYDDDDYED
jgi:hypothetical protein